MLEKLSWLFGCLCSFCAVLLFRSLLQLLDGRLLLSLCCHCWFRLVNERGLVSSMESP